MVFLILLAFSCVTSIALYVVTSKITNEEAFESDYFLSGIVNYNYATYYKTLLKDENKTLTKEQIAPLVTGYDTLDSTTKDKLVGAVNDTLQSDWDNIPIQYGGLAYYVSNQQNSAVVSNDEEIAQLVSEDNYKKLEEEYDFYMVCQYDQDGNLTINQIKGVSLSEMESYLAQPGKTVGYWNEVYDEETDSYEAGERIFSLENPKNMTYIYGYTFHVTSDGMSDVLRNELYSRILLYVIACIGAASLVILFFGFGLPYTVEKQLQLTGRLIYMPIEVLSFVGFFVGIGVVFVTAIGIPSLWVALRYPFDSKNTGLIQVAAVVLQPLLILFCLYTVFYVVVLLKHIIDRGILTYIKEQSIIIRTIRNICYQIRDFIQNITNIMLDQKKDQRKIILIFGINAVVTFCLCSLVAFGAALSIIYNLIVFYVVMKKYDKMEQQYQSLVSQTKYIVDGQLDRQIEGDLGIFNDEKDMINHIRNGLKIAVEEEVKSQNMKTELITNVSHDLKTPLTSIITYIDLMKKESTTEEEKKGYIDILDRKSQRLKKLIEDLFEISKTTSRNITLDRIPVDLVMLMREVIVEYEEQLEEKQLTMKAQYEAEQLIASLDSQKAYRIVDNLVGNIVKYSMDGTRVYICAKQVGNQGVLSFKNISKYELNMDSSQLTERFVRGDASRNTEGSGLGLAIAESLIQLQDGTLDITVDGDLFKVVVTFPLIEKI